MPNPLLDIRNLTFEVDRLAILDRLDLGIQSGEIHALLGANGSGKTTLAYLLMGCEGYVPTAGKIQFDGTDLLSLKVHERARLGLTLAWQEPARFEGVTVREYLTLGKLDCDPESALKQVGLAPDRYLHRRMDKALSGGERHRIEVALGHRILSHRTVPGRRVDLDETPDAIIGKLIIEAGAQIAQPIHMCFGLAHPTGKQQIKIDVHILEGAQAQVLSHCLFPIAQAAEHRMQAIMEIGPGASLTYTEGHYHGPHGSVQVLPHATIRIGKGARYFSDFSLLSGSVGNLDIDYLVDVEEAGIAELSAKIFAHKTDHITLKEAVMLRGERSHGLIKTRVVLEGQAQADITGITEAYAKGARGHVDCMEIVQGQAKASAIPIVRVFHPEAKVTHEAAIGSVDKKELETLMARGLSSEQAVELIVSGILR